jgi:protein-disulfide isomerase
MDKSKGTTGKGTSTKRQAIRDKRRQEQRKQRLYIILGIVAVALIIALIVIIPSLQPAGDIVTVTPVELPMVDGRSLGDPNAPVKIDVYVDFQCPSCKNFSEDVEPKIFDQLVASGDVFYTFRHFPFLDDNVVGKESDQAANASMCAMDQDRFWDYHAILFANWNGENQNAFSDKRLVAFAESLGLDMDSFNNCFEANKFKADIDSDLAAGRMKGVKGTPSVFVNGEILTPGYVPSFDEISQAVDAALAESGN